MKRFDPRLWLGVLLVFGGVLALLDAMNVISNSGGIFWGLIFAAAGALFIYMLLSDRNNWWAAFPAFTLLGLAAQSILPPALSSIDGLVFFAGISLAFWWVYFTNTERWWAIIPAGVLLTLGTVSALEAVFKGDVGGGFFFLGLGLTFILVAVLPGGSTRSWAFVPGVILLIFGALLGTSAEGLAEYILPTILIILGGYFVIRFFTSRSAG